jgi:outer membrane protein assembly factor BamB
MTTGINTDTSEVDVELERMLDNLRFMCMGPDGLIVEKYEYYKEQLLSMYSSEVLDDDVIESDNKESITPVEQPSSPIVSSDGPMDSPWSMKCHDVHHTSQSPYSTVDTYAEKWRFKCDWLEDTPVIDTNGIIYFGCSDRYLYAVYPNGTLKWKYKAGGIFWGSSPAINEDGTIYVGSWDTGLYAINPDGTKKWRIGIGGSIASSPAIADDGTIYVGTMSSGNSIVAVNPNGTKKWNYKTGYSITGGPAIGDDGTIYCGSGDTYFYAINPDGTPKWRFKTGHYIKGPPSIADDGTVYIGSYDDYLYAIYPNNGTMKWKCRIGYGSETNPSIANDGTIYIGGNKLYAVNPNGTMKWSFGLGDGHIHQSSPTISADGTIYFGTDDTGYIYAVNPNGTQKWRKKIAKYWVESSPSIAEDGTIYIGSSNDMSGGHFHAFGPQETNDPPTAPTITGPSEGKVDTEYDFIFKSTDPDRNPVSYFIEWGDGETTGWTKDYASGEKATYSHTWSKRGNFIIKAKAKDTFGLESEKGTLTVTIPRDKSTDNMLFRLLERLPLLERLLLFIK